MAARVGWDGAERWPVVFILLLLTAFACYRQVGHRARIERQVGMSPAFRVRESARRADSRERNTDQVTENADFHMGVALKLA